MPTPRRRRLAGAASLAIVLGGLALVTPSPAHADVLDPLSAGAVLTTIDYDEDCILTGTGSREEFTPVADGLARTFTLNNTASAAPLSSPDAVVSTANAAVTSTVTFNQSGGQLSSITAQSGASAEISSADESCIKTSEAALEIALAFELVRPAYVTIKATARGIYAQAIVLSGDPLIIDNHPGTTIVSAMVGGSSGRSIGTGLLPAGKYVGMLVSAAAVQPNRKAAGESTIEITFDGPGVATNKATGAGKKFVTLPDADNCSNNTAVVTWTKKAGKKKSPRVKKAVFKVDGVKVGQVKGKKATKGKTTTLKKLPAEKAFTIEGTITLKSGRTVTVQRSYQACS